MKRILVISVIVLGVILALKLSLPSVALAAGGEKEVELAQEAGQAWLDSTVELTGEPLEWAGAYLTTSQVCYDLQGEPNAYMFAIENDGEVVGYIIVGSSDHGYPMLEAADVPPPVIPSADKVKSTLKRDLAIDVASIGRPTRLLYLGFDNLYAVYEAGRQEVAVDLKFDCAVPAANLTGDVPSPEEYKANKKATEEANPKMSGSSDLSSLSAESSDYEPLALESNDYNLLASGSSDYNWLPMEYYDGSEPMSCGPESGTSIGRYYKDIWRCDSLPDDEEMYSCLCTEMHWSSSSGTSIIYYGYGFVKMAQEYGYDNFRYRTETNPALGYWDIVQYIDWGYPTALGGKFSGGLISTDDEEVGYHDWPPGKSHFVAIKGYHHGYGGYEHVVICTDSYTRANWLYLNWDYPVEGRGTCTIKGSATEDFEWGSDGTSLATSGGDVEWTVSKDGNSVAEIDTAHFLSGTRSARIYRDGSHSEYEVYASYASFRPNFIGFYLRKGGTAYAYIINGDGTHRIRVRITSAEMVQYYDDAGYHNTGYTISANTWYLIELRNINWDAATYDIHVDGDLVKSGAAMDTYSGNNGYIYYGSSAGSGTFWVDDVRDARPVIEDFEWGDDGDSLATSGGDVDWTVSASGSSYAQIDDDMSYLGTRSAKFYRDGSHSVYARSSLYRPEYIGCYVRKSGSAYVYFYNGDGIKRIVVRITSGEKLQYYDTAYRDVCTVSANSWHRIEFRDINWSAHTYDIYVDGHIKANNVGMHTYSGTNGLIYYGSYAGSGTVWVDDISHEKPVPLIDDFEWGSDGTSLEASGGEAEWNVTELGDSVAEIDGDQYYSGSRSARLYCDGGGSVEMERIKAFYYQPPQDYRGFWLRKDAASDFRTYGGDGDHMIEVGVLPSDWPSGWLRYRDGTSWHDVCQISIDEWHLIEFKDIDWAGNTYDIYIDGTKRSNDTPMKSSVPYYNGKVYFSNGGDEGNCWIDNIT